MFVCQESYAQRKCGFQDQIDVISINHPEFKDYLNSKKASLQGIADNYIRQKSNEEAKTTSWWVAVPVIFHFIIDSAQLTELGGIAGIKQRIDSQIIVLNRDYNRQNPDSALIPSGWKSLYANVGIYFGLATKDTNGSPSLGYDIRITNPSTGFNIGTSGYTDPKHASTGGLDAWNVNYYMNVWCINFKDNAGLLGSTTPKSWTPSGGGIFNLDNEQGICINYKAVGKRTLGTDYYPGGGTEYDKGRTLTHEVGHFFEIWHVWGDDGGVCPWSTGGGDDGLSDTPPQGTSTAGNPTYTVSGGTINDGCMDSSTINVQPIGIACLSYLDYTDDAGMHLFTTQQAAVMASMVANGGENADLVRHPELTAAVHEVLPASNINLVVSPNPTSGVVSVIFDATNQLQQLSVINTLGQEVQSFNILNNANGIYSINLSGLCKGIYYVKCNFASGSITRKILLQ